MRFVLRVGANFQRTMTDIKWVTKVTLTVQEFKVEGDKERSIDALKQDVNKSPKENINNIYYFHDDKGNLITTRGNISRLVSEMLKIKNTYGGRC